MRKRESVREGGREGARERECERERVCVCVLGACKNGKRWDTNMRGERQRQMTDVHPLRSCTHARAHTQTDRQTNRQTDRQRAKERTCLVCRTHISRACSIGRITPYHDENGTINRQHREQRHVQRREEKRDASTLEQMGKASTLMLIHSRSLTFTHSLTHSLFLSHRPTARIFVTGQLAFGGASGSVAV